MKIIRLPHFSNAHFKEVFTGSSVALSLRILGILAGYIFTFMVSRFYGARGVGIYSLTLSILVILELLGTLGFKTSILRFVGQFSAENSHHKIKSLYKNILEIIVPLSFLLAIILFIFAPKIAVLVFHKEALTIPFRIISFIVPLYVVNSVNLESIRGLKNISLSEYLRNLNEPLLSIFLLFIIGFLINNYYVPIITFSLASAGSFLISTSYMLKRVTSFPKRTEESLSKTELLKISSPMMITAFSFLIMGRINTIMLGMFSTTENVGIYEVALRMAAVTSLVLYAINTIAAPKFSELYWARNKEDLKKVVRFSSKLIFLFSFPFLVLFILFPRLFLGIFGKEFIAGQSALIFLTIGQFVNSASGSVGYFLNMTGRQHFFRNIILIATLINTVLGYLLIPKYGINGAALATMVSMVFWNIWCATYIKIKENINTFYLPGVFR